MEKLAYIFKNNINLSFPALFFLMSPGFCSAQAAIAVADSVSVEKIFLNIVNWGLIVIVVLGVILMPIAGLSWYRKNKTDHVWIEFFKSGSFVWRFIVILAAFMLWYFKLVDRIVNSVL